MADQDIRLWQGEANPKNIKLRPGGIGSGDVLYSSTNSIVPYARTIIYQSLAFVAVVTAADGWFAPLSTPTLRGGLPTHEQQSLAFVKAASFPEAVSIDKWLQPLSEPVRLRSLPTSEHPYLAIGLSDTARDARWFMPLSEPVRWRGLGAASQPYLAFVEAAPFPESVTADRWVQPLSVPTRIRGLPTASQPYLAFVEAAPFSEAESRWFSALSEPTRRKPTVQPDGLSWSYFTPASAEVVTVDKYYTWLSEPVRLRSLAANQQPYLFFVQADPFPESVTADRWWRPLNEPTRAKVSAASQPTLSWSYFTPASTEDVTVDRWLQQFSQPTLRPVSVAWQLSLAWGEFTPTPAVRPSVGRVSEGGGRRVHIKPRKAWDRTLTPENWDEIQALLRAEQKALEKADSLENAKAKAALERATDAASDAIGALERQSFEAGQAAKLTRALQAAAGAESVKATLRHAQLVNEYATALIAHLAEMEDEDEAIVLLMM